MYQSKKICSKCKELKPATPEYFYRTKNNKDGLNNSCKECHKKYEKEYRNRPEIKIRDKKYSQTHKRKIAYKNQRLKRTYKLSLTQHLKLYLAQDGCCKLCKKAIPYSKICVEHNHKTGKVRGLVCHSCNNLIGYVESNRELLEKTLVWINEPVIKLAE